MPSCVPRREYFLHPERLSPAWALRKGRKRATCETWLHIFGVELRAFIGSDLVQSYVCRSQEELIRVQEEWRAAFEAKGWTR